MAYVVSLTDYAPPPRYDGVAFTSARFEEATASTGPWAEIDAQPLLPLDPDPTDPKLRNFTVTASSPTVWLRIVFVDPTLAEAYTEPVYIGGNPTLATPADVRRVMRLRDNTAVGDDDLNHWLSVAESFMLPGLPDFQTFGTQVEYNVRGNAIIRMDTRGATPKKVTTFTTNDAPAYSLTSLYGYHVDTRTGTIRLAGDSDLTYDRVEIDYTYANGVPAAVREAIALTAASLYAQSPRIFSGLRSETIGDYSYTLSDKDIEDIVPAKAKKLLRPFRRKPRVFVV